LGVTFEAVVATQALYETGSRNAKFRPVVFREEDERFIPLELRRFNWYRVETPANYQALLRWLHEAPQIVAPDRPPPLPPICLPPPAPPAPITADIDHVSFSVFAPGVIRPAQQFILDLWAHLPTQTDEMTSLAREFARDRRLGIKAQVAVARDTVLSVVLDLPLLRIKDPSDTIVWAGIPVYASFIVDVPADVVAGNHAGRVIISASGIPIAKVTFSLPIEPTGMRAEEAPQRLPTTRYQPRSAFASFSSRDREEVLGRVQGMTKVCRDLDVFVDVLSLRSGQDWEMQIRQQIPTRDVFFLFWSLNAARSKEVEKEWRIALEMRGLSYIDPIPLTDPRDSPPPNELARLHFNDIYVAYIKLEKSLKKLRKRRWWEFWRPLN
jgi:TIR domain